MKKYLLALAVVGAFASISGVAQARDVGVTAEVGTTGLGLHLVTPIREDLNARIGFNAMNFNLSESSDDTDYDIKADLQTFDVLLDYYPAAGSSFRLTGGLIYNGNKLTAKARAKNGTYTFNGETYSAADVGTVDGRMDFKKIAPYLGIGWGNAVAASGGWGFAADVGVMFQGSPDVNLASNNCTAPAVACERLRSDLQAENRELNSSAHDFQYYPVVRVGASYRF